MSKLFLKLKRTLLPVISSRVFIITAIFIAMSGVLLGRLFYLQIIKGEEYLDNFKLQIHKTQEIKSTRGNIYDRNGNVLAYNELAYAVTIEDNGAYDNLTNSEKNAAINNNIKDMMEILDSNGDQEVSYFHIILDENGDYAFEQDPGTSRNRFIADVYGEKSFDDLDNEKKNATPDMIMKYLCEDRYDLDQEKVGKGMAIRIVNIRFAMSQTSYSKYLVTTVAKNVSDQTVTMVKENSDKLVGINITEDYLRKYEESEYFAPVIGYTGVMSADEYDELASVSDEYSLNDIIGKAGIEQFMDLELRGQKGQKTFYVDSLGTVLETTDVEEPVAGVDLYLTIDKDLQIASYKILEQELAGIVLRKLVDKMEYDPHTAESTYDIEIPIGDVYVTLIDNNILDMNRFPDADPGTNQSVLYEAFQGRQGPAIAALINEIRNPSDVYMNLSSEMRAYMTYTASDLLTYTAQIIDRTKIISSDEVYKAWNDDGSVSLRDYLNRAVAEKWIDLTKLEDGLGTDMKYASSDEIIEAIIAYLEQELFEDEGFSKLVYKYLILDGTISPYTLCYALFEQGALEWDEASVEGLNNGTLTPFDFLYEQIRTLKITPAQLALEPCTGSIVVTDPNNGEVLALVSYPGYDNNRLANTMDTAYYNKLVKDKSRPLYNYATQQKCAPGSTYKMLTTSAGQEEGVIDRDTEFACSGEFKLIDQNPKCWIYPDAHGNEDNITAIRDSCNVFFYNVAYLLGSDENQIYSSSASVKVLEKYAKKYGFDSVSGVELQEAEPQISDTDGVRTAIGQGTNNYANVQMARYITTVANCGTLYNLTLLSKSVDPSGTLVDDFEPEIVDTLDFKQETWDIIHEGMAQMADSCSQLAASNWHGLHSAGKTGTAEQSSIHPDNVMYVGYAPFDVPQIAYSIRIANGYTSAYTAEIANDLLKYYFNLTDPETFIDGTANVVNGAAGD